MLPDVRRTGLDWPIWIDHPEGLIHTNTGKWLVAPPHRFFVEGASGEFPQYYPSLSDTLLNLVAGPLGIPAMTVQAVLFGPLAGGAFLLVQLPGARPRAARPPRGARREPVLRSAATLPSSIGPTRRRACR